MRCQNSITSPNIFLSSLPPLHGFPSHPPHPSIPSHVLLPLLLLTLHFSSVLCLFSHCSILLPITLLSVNTGGWREMLEKVGKVAFNEFNSTPEQTEVSFSSPSTSLGPPLSPLLPPEMCSPFKISEWEIVSICLVYDRVLREEARRLKLSEMKQRNGKKVIWELDSLSGKWVMKFRSRNNKIKKKAKAGSSSMMKLMDLERSDQYSQFLEHFEKVPVKWIYGDRDAALVKESTTSSSLNYVNDVYFIRNPRGWLFDRPDAPYSASSTLPSLASHVVSSIDNSRDNFDMIMESREREREGNGYMDSKLSKYSSLSTMSSLSSFVDSDTFVSSFHDDSTVLSSSVVGGSSPLRRHPSAPIQHKFPIPRMSSIVMPPPRMNYPPQTKRPLSLLLLSSLSSLSALTSSRHLSLAIKLCGCMKSTSYVRRMDMSKHIWGQWTQSKDLDRAPLGVGTDKDGTMIEKRAVRVSLCLSVQDGISPKGIWHIPPRASPQSTHNPSSILSVLPSSPSPLLLQPYVLSAISYFYLHDVSVFISTNMPYTSLSSFFAPKTTSLASSEPIITHQESMISDHSPLPLSSLPPSYTGQHSSPVLGQLSDGPAIECTDGPSRCTMSVFVPDITLVLDPFRQHSLHGCCAVGCREREWINCSARAGTHGKDDSSFKGDSEYNSPIPLNFHTIGSAHVALGNIGFHGSCQRDFLMKEGKDEKQSKEKGSLGTRDERTPVFYTKTSSSIPIFDWSIRGSEGIGGKEEWWIGPNGSFENIWKHGQSVCNHGYQTQWRSSFSFNPYFTQTQSDSTAKMTAAPSSFALSPYSLSRIVWREKLINLVLGFFFNPSFHIRPDTIEEEGEETEAGVDDESFLRKCLDRIGIANYSGTTHLILRQVFIELKTIFGPELVSMKVDRGTLRQSSSDEKEHESSMYQRLSNIIPLLIDNVIRDYLPKRMKHSIRCDATSILPHLYPTDYLASVSKLKEDLVSLSRGDPQLNRGAGVSHLHVHSSPSSSSSAIALPPFISLPPCEEKTIPPSASLDIHINLPPPYSSYFCDYSILNGLAMRVSPLGFAPDRDVHIRNEKDEDGIVGFMDQIEYSGEVDLTSPIISNAEREASCVYEFFERSLAYERAFLAQDADDGWIRVPICDGKTLIKEPNSTPSPQMPILESHQLNRDGVSGTHSITERSEEEDDLLASSSNSKLTHKPTQSFSKASVLLCDGCGSCDFLPFPSSTLFSTSPIVQFSQGCASPFIHMPRGKLALRKAFGLPLDRFLMVFTGSLSRFDQQTLAICAGVLKEVVSSALVIIAQPAQSVSSIIHALMSLLHWKRCRQIYVLERAPRIIHIKRSIMFDVTLDPCVCNCVSDVVDSLYCGVPVVSMDGGTRPSNSLSCSILRSCGLGNLCAANADDYINIIRKMAREQSFRNEMRRKTMDCFKYSAGVFDTGALQQSLTDGLFEATKQQEEILSGERKRKTDIFCDVLI
ncbi:UDP-N-acetylglucosamine--peptide N-acetylglucosaminyltransferase 110kDa subunit like protein [Aduncisulcus paluster]|uniref:UDP-N-acetylglucosamine--peptide N-acetylglucosaminyltransferase 110kDa subunit like protein n=1 Tax=Aduncisulcus paluster TaxID=2918883 RepID=A0ABQ5KGT8_9EUKA|nr:UDP-N-acetylglucosamine--peptide N-acetylglucosaminyltransferase 110kDa subunit like protein [Aduncisulcus paluster]